MNRTFLEHQWTAFWRSRNIGKSMLIMIFLGLGIIYLFANLLVASFFLDKILLRAFPDRDVVDSFNGLILYYFLLDLLLRFQFQELPTLRVKPYLNLPIKRNSIVSYLSITSLLSGFNVAPFLLTIPFLIKVLLFEGESFAMWGLYAAILGLMFFNHFFSIWLKRKVHLNAWFMAIFLCTIAGLIMADIYFEGLSIFNISRVTFNLIRKSPSLSILLLLLGLVMYLINRAFLKRNLYVDDLQRPGSGERKTTDIPVLGRFGVAGELAALELKLIFRNKRPRSTLMMASIFLFYGFFFYKRMDFDSTMLIFASTLMTGVYMINYGQFMFSWQSAHFDGLLACNISPHDFYRSKFILFTIFCTANLLISSFYGFYNARILLAHAMLYLWNLGFSSLVVLAFANLNYKYIDLSRGASFNWQGTGASQFLLGFPLMLIPLAMHFLASNFMSSLLATILLGFIGLLLMITRPFWIKLLIANFRNQRHTIAQGFREQ